MPTTTYYLEHCISDDGDDGSSRENLRFFQQRQMPPLLKTLPSSSLAKKIGGLFPGAAVSPGEEGGRALPCAFFFFSAFPSTQLCGSVVFVFTTNSLVRIVCILRSQNFNPSQQLTLYFHAPATPTIRSKNTTFEAPRARFPCHPTTIAPPLVRYIST